MALIGSLVGGKYTIEHEIGQGAYCAVHLGCSNDASDNSVAIKLELLSTKHPQLAHEASVYESLADVTGVPNVHWFGVQGEYNALVLDLLGPSVEDLRKCCGNLALKNVLLLADKMINLIEAVHERGLVHGDLQPDHFLMGLGAGRNSINLIDFGCASRYRHPATGTQESSTVMAEALCASINYHRGEDIYPRDDLESIGYILLILHLGPPPWKKLRADIGREKYNMVTMKRHVPTEGLHHGVPKQIAEYLVRVRSIPDDATPDYSNLRQMFRTLYEELGFADSNLDWTIQN